MGGGKGEKMREGNTRVDERGIEPKRERERDGGRWRESRIVEEGREGELR